MPGVSPLRASFVRKYHKWCVADVSLKCRKGQKRRSDLQFGRTHSICSGDACTYTCSLWSSTQSNLQYVGSYEKAGNPPDSYDTLCTYYCCRCRQAAACIINYQVYKRQPSDLLLTTEHLYKVTTVVVMIPCFDIAPVVICSMYMPLVIDGVAYYMY